MWPPGRGPGAGPPPLFFPLFGTRSSAGLPERLGKWLTSRASALQKKPRGGPGPSGEKRALVVGGRCSAERPGAPGSLCPLPAGCTGLPRRQPGGLAGLGELGLYAVPL